MMHRFDTLRRGLLAGILASLVLAMFDFVTDGAPGNGFPSVLRWFGFTMADPTIGHWAGLLLLLVLGGVFGLIFGALQRGRPITTGRAPLAGLVLGVLWWLLFEVVLANITNHASVEDGGGGMDGDGQVGGWYSVRQCAKGERQKSSG